MVDTAQCPDGVLGTVRLKPALWCSLKRGSDSILQTARVVLLRPPVCLCSGCAGLDRQECTACRREAVRSRGLAGLPEHALSWPGLASPTWLFRFGLTPPHSGAWRCPVVAG